MGSWATSRIAFGFDLGEKRDALKIFLTPQIYHPEENFVEEDGDTWHDYDMGNIYVEWAALQKGMKRPPLKSPQWEDFIKISYGFQDEYPLDIVSYNTYGEYARYFLALKSTEQTGYQENAKPISTYPVDVKIFKEYCEKFNVPYQEPQWHMLTHYG